MVTDAVIRPTRRRAMALSVEWRILLTILFLTAYVYGFRIPLPMVELDESYLGYGHGFVLVSVLSLGINPLITGFVLAELFSLTTAPGRRWRQGGAAGRATINRMALIMSLILAAVQSLGIARRLEGMTNPGGLPVVPHPGALFTLIMILTLTAATAGVFAFAQLLSAYGIGNGFVLLLLIGIVRSMWVDAREKWENFAGSLLEIAGILLVVVLVVVLFRFIRSAEDRWLPAFPQGGLPVSPVVAILPSLLWLWRWVLSSSLPRISDNAWLGITLLGIPLISWITFHLFSSRPRLEANLTDARDFLDDLAASLRRRAVQATVLLTLGAAATLYWSQRWPDTLAASVPFLELLFLMAIALDLWDEMRFRRRHAAAVLLVQLDNVHFSYRLEEELQQAEIDALARGHQLRSLLFFFGPLYKIDMLVPAEQLDRAREVLAELETAREVRVF